MKKLAILSSFPKVDGHVYKKVFLQSVIADREKFADVALVYARSGVSAHLKHGISTNKLSDSVKRLRSAGGTRRGPQVDVPSGKLGDLARSAGIAVQHFEDFKHAACSEFLKSYEPDLIATVSGLYIPRAILDLPRDGVIGGHYGKLPRMRGMDTIRWSVLLDVPLEVTLMILAPQYDMGDIVARRPVVVEPGDSILDLRFKCQVAVGEQLAQSVRDWGAGELTRTTQTREQGSRFYEMGQALRDKVDGILRDRRYAHYTELSECRA